MPIYLYAGLGADDVAEQAAAFTRDDHFQALAGFQVMATHFHMGLVGKVQAAGAPQAKVPDLEVLRAAGINIVAPIDGGAGAASEVAAETERGPARAGNVDNPRWMQWTRALGAPPEQVRRMFVRHGLLLASIGLACGLAAAAAVTRLMSTLLFETSPLDPVTYAAVSVVLASAAVSRHSWVCDR